MQASDEDIQLLQSPLTLPNGRTVPNRLVKVAMEEGIAVNNGRPGRNHRELYTAWARGGWGLIVTGNVQVDPNHLATPHDLFVQDSSPATIASYALLNRAITSSASNPAYPSDRADATTATTPFEPLTLVQLSHPGLQSSAVVCMARPPWSPAVAPCTSRPDLGTSWLGRALGYVFWPIVSRRLSVDEWIGVVQRFVDSARVMEEAGWGGVQIHAAHGYLLAEYLSALTNPDPEPLPGAPADLPLRLHLLYLILHGIHARKSSRFTLAVKINCSDFVQGGLDEEQAAEIVKTVVSWGIVDILEVSGGTYATPAFATGEKHRPVNGQITRQSLFSHFTSALLPHLPSPPAGPAIILTGGMHDRSLIASSLRNRACDLAGIGRPACLDPSLPNRIIFNPAVMDDDTALACGEDIPGSALFKWVFGGKKSVLKSEDRRNDPADPYETTPAAPARSNSSSGGIPLVGASISILWHEMQLSRIGRGVEPNPEMNWLIGLFVEFFWWGLFGGGPAGWFSRGNVSRSV